MVNTSVSSKRVAIFIDYTNVWYRLVQMTQSDPNWKKWYDPYKLANHLVGNRQLEKIYFYCAPPPAYLLQDGPNGISKYWKQISYYEEIKKLPKVELKYATLNGVRGDIHEKNLDTQLCTDLIMKSMSNEFDVAMLISNDGDYVSAVEAVKTLGRKIELLYFKKKCSMDLRKICDVPRRARRSHFEELNFVVNNNGTNP